MEEMKIDALAFTGHKSLLGPQGIGGFVIKDHLAEKIPPFIEGGTGSFSEFEEQPTYLPDKYEAGTPNLPGIFGLNASLNFLQKTGIKAHLDHETFLSSYFINEIMNMPRVKVVGPDPLQKRAHLVSVDFLGLDNAEIAYQLLHDYNIITRVGLHCAPHAHKTLGTFPQGTVRFSFSSFNTQYELKKAIEAIHTILKN
jgi:selenocysteine lyase/cysteine desulfurase